MNLQNAIDFLNSVQAASKERVVEILEKDQHNIEQIIRSLMKHDSNDTELADVVYSYLFTLYQNGGDIQKVFVLQFLPAFIWEYLFISCNHGMKGHGKLEAVLLAIYNSEVVDKDGKTKYQQFRLPSLTRPSLYHEPSLAKTSASALTESALSRHEQSEVVYRPNGPGKKLSRIPACYRFSVVAFVLEQYNNYIAFMGDASLQAACKMALLVASCGFKDLCIKPEVSKELENFSDSSRIPLDNNTLVQLVYIVYFAYYNGFSVPARGAFEALSYRIEYGLFSQAYLLTQSIAYNMEAEGKDVAPLGLNMTTTTADASAQQTPKCLDNRSSSWKRRCPYEILLSERLVPSVFQLDGPLSLTKQKSSRPKKTKSWVNISGGGRASPSPTTPNARSPNSLGVLASPQTPAEHLELVTGL